ncbi:MAG: hypothetical protein ACD_60C00100G0020 [uncultured bacterium]|nr:MAG: hypothetical protein ACD_60C00100G0020 [uncultured bacterium]
MKHVLSMILLTLIFSASFSTIAKAKDSYIVPFQIVMDPNSKIIADYSFNPHTQTLVCKTDSGMPAEVNWVYKDFIHKGTLPITLVDDARFQGELADPEGRVAILNASSVKIVASCDYQNMG